MKKLILICCILFVAWKVGAQKTEERSLDSFSIVNVFGNMEVQLIKADKERMVIDSKEIDVSKINSRITRNELRISMSKDLFSATSKVKIILYYKNIAEISSTAGADIVSDKVFKGDKIKFNAASGGSISLSIDINILDASVSEGSIISLDGNVNYQKISATLDGTYDAFELISDEAVVKANTGGKIKVYAAKLLDAVARTKGYVGYKGKPEKTNFDSSTGGEIKDVE